MGLKFQNTFLSISSHCGVISGYFSPWPISHHRNFGVRVCWNLYWWILMLNNITTGVCYLGISDDFWNFRPLSFFLLHMVVASMFYIVDLWFRLSGVIYLTDLHQLWNYVSNSSLPVNSKELKIYSAIVCIHILNGIVQDYSYSTDDSIEGVEVGISWLDEFLPILSIASDIIQIFSEYYALSFIFITSLTLNANVEAVAKRIEDAIIQTQHPKEREPGFETIENNLHSKNLKFLPPTVQLEDIIEKVYTLKNIFKIFNKVHGIYAFLFIFEASYLGVVSAFGGKNEALGLNFVLALESALVVFSICLMGTRMHLKIRTSQRNLRNLILKSALDKEHDSGSLSYLKLKEVVLFFLSWNWAFSANELFTINNALIPAIFGTALTYVILILQLIMSGN